MSKHRVLAAPHPSEEFTKAELDDSLICDLKLIFCKNAPAFPALMALRDNLLHELDATPPPPGLSSALASGPKRKPRSLRNAETLIANLLVMRAKEKSSLAVSLSPNTYSNRLVSSGFINLIKLAAHKSRDVLILKEGFRDPSAPGNSRLTRIKPTRRFCDLVVTLQPSELAFRFPAGCRESRA